MKSVIYFCLAIITISCASTKVEKSSSYTNSVIYLFPHAVEILLDSQMKRMDKAILRLGHNGIYFKVSIKNASTESDKEWANSTNRKALIGGELVPIVFDFDNNFSIAESQDQILEKIKSERFPLFKRVNISFHWSYFVIFDNLSGEIFEIGFDGLQPNEKKSD